MEFDGFVDGDFDAYLQNKWSSNVFNLERLQVKQKLEALGRQLGPALRAADGSPLECEVSTEHPALWNHHRVTSQSLFFSRNKDARRELESIISRARGMASLIEDPSPLRNHILLSVMIDAAELEVALKLHADANVDRDNLIHKCQDFFRREKLLQLLHGLPQGFTIGVADSDPHPTSGIDDDALQAALAALPRSAGWLTVRAGIPRQDAVAQGLRVAETAAAWLAELLPLLHYGSWRRDNDFVSIADQLRSRAGKTLAKGLAKKDRVRVVNGVFTGKTGVVQSADAKGVVTVLLGKLSVKLKGDDLVKV